MKTSHRMLVILLLFFGFVLLLAVATRRVLSIRNVDETANPSGLQAPHPELSVSAYTRWKLPEGAIVRLGKGGITAIHVSPAGSRFAVATTLGIWLCDAQTGTDIALLTGHRTRINAIAFSPDGRTLVSGDAGGEIRRWQAATGALLETFSEVGPVVSLVFSDDGTKVTAAFSEAGSESPGALRQWKLRGWEQGIRLHQTLPKTVVIHRENTSKRILGEPVMALSPAALVLVTATRVMRQRHQRFPIRIWDGRTGRLSATLTGHTRWIRALSLSPDGDVLASGDESKTIHLWDVKGGTRLATFKVPTGGIYALAFSPNGNLLASGHADGTIRLWDATKTEERWWDAIGQYLPSLILNGHKAKVTCLAFSPDGKTLISGSRDGTLRGWETLSGSQRFSRSGFMGPIRGLVFAEKGSTLASVNNLGSSTFGIIQHRLWDIGTGSQLSMHELNAIEAKAISPDGTVLVAEESRGRFTLWDMRQHRAFAALAAVHPKDDLNVKFVFSSDSKTFASGDKDGSVRLWKIPHRSQSSVKRFFTPSPEVQPLFTGFSHKGHSGYVSALAFSPDSKILASGGWDGRIRLWRADTGDALQTLTRQKHQVGTLVFSPDNKRLASRSGNEIYLWDIATGNSLRKFALAAEKSGGALVFSPDGSLLVSGGWDGILRLWHLQTGNLASMHTGHTQPIWLLVFSPDGRTLASASSGGTILLWDWEQMIRGEDR